MKYVRTWSLKAGDRIRLKVPTMLGWKGLGTVAEDCAGWDLGEDLVRFIPDGRPDAVFLALRSQVAKLRDQAR